MHAHPNSNSDTFRKKPNVFNSITKAESYAKRSWQSQGRLSGFKKFTISSSREKIMNSSLKDNSLYLFKRRKSMGGHLHSEYGY